MLGPLLGKPGCIPLGLLGMQAWLGLEGSGGVLKSDSVKIRRKKRRLVQTIKIPNYG